MKSVTNYWPKKTENCEAEWTQNSAKKSLIRVTFASLYWSIFSNNRCKISLFFSQFLPIKCILRAERHFVSNNPFHPILRTRVEIKLILEQGVIYLFYNHIIVPWSALWSKKGYWHFGGDLCILLLKIL